MDLSGLIIIDFIDMHNFSNRNKRENLKKNVERIEPEFKSEGITHFGLLEMSRQNYLRESNVKWSMNLTNGICIKH